MDEHVPYYPISYFSRAEMNVTVTSNKKDSYPPTGWVVEVQHRPRRKVLIIAGRKDHVIGISPRQDIWGC